MKDALPRSAAGNSELIQSLEERSRDVFGRFGYGEIRTPILEERALFVRAIGEETDIVSKEMFAFQDRGERDVVMRPEGTAPIVRAYLEANLDRTAPFQKLYYLGSMFRAERPQAGRLREFHQIGAEAIGSKSAAIDAEIIVLAASILDRCGIKGYTIRLNNLGCHDDKARLSETLRQSLSEKSALLCDDCRKRLNVNPLRVLDCKKETCRNVVRGAFTAIDFLCATCKDHYNEVKKYLGQTAVKDLCKDDPYIVRGLDYYTSTVFEISHPALGAQDAIGAGGRYDTLIQDMGGPALGAVGFALGVERMLMACANDAAVFTDTHISVYIATMGEKARAEGFRIADMLRKTDFKGCGLKIACDMNYEERSLKSQMRSANNSNARFVLILGDDEVAKRTAMVKNMVGSEQHEVGFDALADFIMNEVQKTMSGEKRC